MESYFDFIPNELKTLVVEKILNLEDYTNISKLDSITYLIYSRLMNYDHIDWRWLSYQFYGNSPSFKLLNVNPDNFLSFNVTSISVNGDIFATYDKLTPVILNDNPYEIYLFNNFYVLPYGYLRKNDTRQTQASIKFMDEEPELYNLINKNKHNLSSIIQNVDFNSEKIQTSLKILFMMRDMD